MHVRTLGLLLLAPATALLLPNLVLTHSDAFWRRMAGFNQGTLYHADAMVRLADKDAVDIVVMGSSVAHTDVRHEHLDERLADLDVHSVNLGLNGASVVTTALQLPEALTLEPRLVILVNAAPSLFRHRRGRQYPTYDAGMAWDLYGPWGFLTDRDHHLAGLLGEVSLLYRYRDVPRAMDTPAYSGVALRDSPRLSTGAVRGAVEAQQALYQVVRRRNQDPLAGDALCLMTRYTMEAGAKLLVVPAPVHPRVRRSGFDRDHLALLRSLQERCGFAMVGRHELPRLGGMSYRDGIHLLPVAQDAFTDAVADRARTLLEEP